MAKTGYNESAISFGEAKVGSMEAFNFSSRASITMVHAEREGKRTSVASTKAMAKAVFSIVMNITSGSEEDETNINEEMDVASGLKIDRMEMVEMEVQSPTDNMHRTIANLQLSSSELAPEEDSQGEDTKDSEDSSYTTHDDSYETPNKHDINSEDYDKALEVSSASLMRFTPTSSRCLKNLGSNYG